MKTKNRTKTVKTEPKANQNPSIWDEDWLTEDTIPTLPVLRFSPTAWAKLLYLRDKSPNEVGGFGITDPDDLLLVEDFVTVKQQVTGVSVKFDDLGVADLFDRQVDLGRKPEQFARIWCHTHPGVSPEPSGTDEKTFSRVFGSCQWAVMMIVAQNGSTYARLSFNVGPGGQILIPVEVDYTVPFEETDHEAWDAEYASNVKAVGDLPAHQEDQNYLADCNPTVHSLPSDFMDEFLELDPEGRQMVLDELWPVSRIAGTEKARWCCYDRATEQ